MNDTLTKRHILKIWWPLAASWVLMSGEASIVSGIISRMPDPEVNLAGYGGIVWPISQFISAPIVMLLAASTALSKDWVSYMKLRRFTNIAGLALTIVHLLVAFTPIYYFIVRDILSVPEEIIQPARVGLMVMVPWSWSIAYRRFNQGVLIRFGHSLAIGLGTGVRLLVSFAVLILGYFMHSLSGVVVAAVALAVGHIVETLFIAACTRPILRDKLKHEPVSHEILTFQAFSSFYIPLSVTQVLFILAAPLTSAALSRMPNPLQSLAIWPAVSGLVFLLRSIGVSYNEVVVALLKDGRSECSLRRFAIWLGTLNTGSLLLFAATPIADFWFHSLIGLTSPLAAMASCSLWGAVLVPGLSVQQSWFQGQLLHNHSTRAISEAMLIFLLAVGTVLLAGIKWQHLTGVHVGLGSLSIGMLMQVVWLSWRSRPIRKAICGKGHYAR